MASRIIIQLLVGGVSALTRAFAMAYQQALANASKGGAASQAARAKAANVARNRMRSDEALRVMNMEKMLVSEESLKKQYERYFAANDPKKGGSFYLQSKVYRANETLLRDLKKGNFDAASTKGSSSSSTTT